MYWCMFKREEAFEGTLVEGGFICGEREKQREDEANKSGAWFNTVVGRYRKRSFLL